MSEPVRKTLVRIEEGSGEVIVASTGSLDISNSGDFREELERASAAAECVTADLRSSAFIDTSILQSLSNAGAEMFRRDRRLKVVVAEASYPQRVLDLAGLGTLMDIVVQPRAGEA